MTTTLSSRIEAVTVYRQGALVRRVARLSPEGDRLPERVRLCGLPLSLDERSLRVQVRSEGGEAPVAVDLKVGLEVGQPDPDLRPADDETLRAAATEERRRSDALELLRAELHRVLALLVAPRPSPEKGKAPRPSPVEGRLALLVLREKEALRLQKEINEATETHRLATLARQDLEAKNARLSSAKQSRAQELRKTVEVGLRAAQGGTSAKAGPLEIAIEYLVPGAHWSPAYTLQLDESLGEGQLAVRASVRQRTGEDWKGVALTLSTAEAMRWTELPELKAIRIGRRQSAPPRPGWRPPPEGASALYADHDAGFAAAARAGHSSGSIGPSGASEVGGSITQVGMAAVSANDIALFESMGRSDQPEAEAVALSEEAPEGMDDFSLDSLDYDEELEEDEEWEESKAEMDFGSAGGPPGEPMMERSMAPPPMASSAMAPQAPPALKAKKSAPRGRRSKGAPTRGGLAHKELAGFAEEDEGLVANPDLLDYGALRMRSPGHSDRGRLVALPTAEITLQLVQELKLEVKVNPLPIITRALQSAHSAYDQPRPAGHSIPETTGGFDYAYAATLPADVPSDGGTHTLALMEAKGEAEATYVCVPRESTDVFRQVVFHNPLEAPLLEGPLDVMVGEDYLLTSRTHNTPAKGELQLGLGVEQAIKVARNVRFEEETTGLVRGKLCLEHEIEVDLTSHLEKEVTVEIRERLPVAVENDDDVDVEEGKVTPPWEVFEQKVRPVKAGRCWKVKLAPAQKTVLKATYLIRIPKGHELVGGNRREVS